MRVFNRARNLLNERHALCERGVCARAMRINAFAFDEFECKPRPPVWLNARIENAGDIRVLQTRENVSLKQHAIMPTARISDEIRKLQSNTSLQPAVAAMRAPHACAATFAEQCVERVGADPLANGHVAALAVVRVIACVTCVACMAPIKEQTRRRGEEGAGLYAAFREQRFREQRFHAVITHGQRIKPCAARRLGHVEAGAHQCVESFELLQRERHLAYS